MPRPTRPVTNREVGARIRSLREASGLTQTRLAKRVGTSQTALSEIERGNRGISAHQAVRLAAALRCSPNQILGTSSHNGNAPRPRSRKLLRRIEQIEALEPEQQAAIIKVLDGILKVHRRARGTPTD